jgi:isopentenyldiphosphate isomerase
MSDESDLKLYVRITCSMCLGGVRKGIFENCSYCDLDRKTYVEASLKTITQNLKESLNEKQKESLIKNIKMKASVVVIINKKDEVLILKRMSPQRDYPNIWGFPGGAAHSNEKPKQAAIRETKEETSLDISDLKYVCRKDQWISIYTSRNYEGEVCLDFEHTAFVWVSIDKVEDYETIPGTKELMVKALKL